HLQAAVGRKMHLVSTKVRVRDQSKRAMEVSKAEAMQVAKVINGQVEMYWQAAASGSPAANDDLKAVIRIAQQASLAAATISQVVARPVPQIQSRIHMLAQHPELHRGVVQQAFLGTTASAASVAQAGGNATGITVAGLVDAYEPLCASETRGMNKVQKDKWRR